MQGWWLGRGARGQQHRLEDVRNKVKFPVQGYALPIVSIVVPFGVSFSDLNIKMFKPKKGTTMETTRTPQVCRIIAFYKFWAIILPTFGGLGLGKSRIAIFLIQNLAKLLGSQIMKPRLKIEVQEPHSSTDHA